MNYQFPEIHHIDDVLPAIEGRSEFIVAQRDWGTVINYMVSMADTFPDVANKQDAIRRECRGLLFYPDGRIMSRRLHKFFSVNERDETAAHQIDLSQPHVILEKLDGSMITPVYTSAGIRWGTKMGITDVSAQAEMFAAKNSAYHDFAEQCRKEGVTPIFEWCSRKQRIVVDYPEDQLILIALRENATGAYVAYKSMVGVAEYWRLPVVKAYAGTAANMEHLITETRDTEGIEGWIIRFDSGQMLKVKGEWYLRIHKTKDNLTLEKNVIDLVVNEKIDDVKPFMLDEDRRRVERFEAVFWQGIAAMVSHYENYWAMIEAAGVDRKTYALEWMPAIQQQDSFAPQVVFGCFGGKDIRKMLVEHIAKNTGTASKVDAVRYLWQGHRWTYSFDADS